MSLKKRITAGVIAAMSCLTMAIPSISASAASANLVGKTIGEAIPVLVEQDNGLYYEDGYADFYCVYNGNTYINTTKCNDYLKEIGQYAAKNRSVLDIDNDGIVECFELNGDVLINKYVAFINMVGRSGILSKYGANAYRTTFARIENYFRNYTADKCKNGIDVWDTIPKSICNTDMIVFVRDCYFNAFFELGHTIGDVNLDGAITSADATLLANYVMNAKPYYDFDTTVYAHATGIDEYYSNGVFAYIIADVNFDGKINLNDVSEIGRYAATHK